MNQLQVFRNSQFGELEATMFEGQPWFGATKAAVLLGYTNPQKAVRDHCKDKGCTFRSVLTNGGEQQIKFISEGNLYRLISRSKLPNAEQFEAWVFDEVLPSIRKHGAYMTEQTIEKALTSPDFLIDLATRLKEEQTARIEAEYKVKKQQPLVLFAETCMSSRNSIKVREMAKLASKNGINIGQNRLFAKLREWGLIMNGSSEPMQRAIDAGWFEVVQGVYQRSSGAETYRTPRVTPKGQAYIINRLKGELPWNKGL
ncbi:phage antirepressor KilAC domain-containing protein [Paenibacillus apiarius]|uniref:phage antirepressor KilAC domain-containing protein n=1 Tax=Paenibacillus apiarius TaxID=46240 RepID=UPI003B3ABD9A